jgi:hypothetical protein
VTSLAICAGPLPATVADCDLRLDELRRQYAQLLDPTSRELAMLEVDRILDRRTALAARDRATVRRPLDGIRRSPFDSRRQAA